jgi:hypothetical protein
MARVIANATAVILDILARLPCLKVGTGLDTQAISITF